MYEGDAGEVSWNTMLWNNAYDWGNNSAPFRNYSDLDELRSALGPRVELGSFKIDHRSCFSTLNLPGRPLPKKVEPPRHALPDAGCPVIDRGALLPNINDHFFGQLPDIGAYERGKPLLEYGHNAKDDNNDSISPAPPGNLRLK